MSIEWSLVFFTLFAGLAAGVFVMIAFIEWKVLAPKQIGLGEALKPADEAKIRSAAILRQIRFPGAVLTLAALIIGGVSSVLHLGHPERIFGALEKPGSGIFLEAILICLFGLIVIFYIAALRRGASDIVCRLLATLGAIPALTLAFALGATYAMPSRPAWDMNELVYIYATSALAMGGFCVATLLSGFKDFKDFKPSQGLIPFFGLPLAFQIPSTAMYIIRLTEAPYPDASRSAARVLMGDLAPLFWIGVVIVGLLIPFIIMIRTTRFNYPLDKMRYGLMCVLIGGIAFRALMFLLGSPVRQFF
jgi:anaerobic dimethyl sulfoxide reductase subunit C (anchor subunit)